MKSAEYIAIEDEFGAKNYQPLDVVIESARGCWVTDVEGREFLDCLSGYSALNQGHCHPQILKALQTQAGTLTLASRAFRTTQLPLLYKKLCALTGFEMALMMNSGAEAIETAIKVARKWGYTKKGIKDNGAEIIVCENNFHGRTTTIISFSSEAKYYSGFGPLTPGFRIIPYGDIEALKAAINKNTAAFLVEPIQGEAGVRIPPDGYLKQARELCSKNNVLLVADEIQTGLGRTGKLFCYEYEGIKPDMLVIGKALSGGFLPVSAVLSGRDVLGVLKPGDHGSTFGGNPLACAVAQAALDVITNEKLAERSAHLGELALKRLQTIVNPNIVEIRGRGLFIGIELNTSARPYCQALMQKSILCKETHETVIRFAPPLVISEEDLLWALDSLVSVLNNPV